VRLESAITYALLAATVYGAADFLGGLASRRSSPSAVVVASQAIGLAALTVVLPFVPGRYAPTDVVWGALAGVGGAFGIALLYRALALGHMGVASPITAVIAACVPVVYGFELGERLRPAALAGVVLAVLAVALVSLGSGPGGSSGIGDAVPRDDRRALAYALASGCALGAFYVLLSRASPAAGLYPLLGARAASVVVCALFAGAIRESVRPVAGSMRMIAASGILDMAANVFYVLALHRGAIAIAAVLTSLYPASTVLLARAFLHERLTPAQWAGVICAGFGVVLIAY
jgi:drug/metabolite transporter (DMT)-like permease